AFSTRRSRNRAESVRPKADASVAALDAVPLVPFGDTERLSASMMYVPIRADGKTIGILSIQSYTLQAYNAQDLDTFQALANHCAGALERIRALTTLRQMEAEVLNISA